MSILLLNMPGAMTFTGNWLYDTFNNPLAASGHEGNFQA